MPAFNSTVSLTKSYYTISKFRNKKNENTHSPEAEEKLIPVGSDVAIVFVFAFFFSNRSFFFSFSNVFIFLTSRRIISLVRFFRNFYNRSTRFLFAKIMIIVLLAKKNSFFNDLMFKN